TVIYPLAYTSSPAAKSRPLAVAAPGRHRLLPDTPTLSELGIKDAEVLSWFGIMAPGGTPQPVIDTLAAAFRTIADEPEFRKLVEQQGMDVVYYGPAEAGRFWTSGRASSKPPASPGSSRHDAKTRSA